VRLLHVGAEGDRAVVRQDDRVARLQVGHNRLGELLRAGRLVDGGRYLAEENFDLWQYAFWNGDAGHGEGRGVRRMAMDDGIHVRPMLVNGEMQQHFAGPLLRPRELLALVIDLADVLALHEAFGTQSRGAKYFLVVEPDGNVAVVRGRETPVIEAAADLADLF